jgi:hypothetical protein
MGIPERVSMTTTNGNGNGNGSVYNGITYPDKIRITYSTLQNKTYNLDLLKRIELYIFKNGNRLTDNDRRELAQRVFIRIFKNLTRKLDTKKDLGLNPKMRFKLKRYFNYVKRVTTNEIIQYMRMLDAEGERKIAYFENIDYTQSLGKIVETLEEGYSTSVKSYWNHFTVDDEEKEDGPKRLFKPRPGPASQSTESTQSVEYKIDRERLIAMVKHFLEPEEVILLKYLLDGEVQRKIYEDLYKGRYKNVSVVTKKFRKVKKKLMSRPEIHTMLQDLAFSSRV